MIVGIDPGLTGAIAALDDNGNCVALHDIPTVLKPGKSAARVRKMVDAIGLADIIDDLIPETSEFVVEAVASMGGQGVASVFSLGDTFGCIRGVINGQGGSIVFVPPNKWKADIGLGDQKGESLVLARQWFPECEEQLSRMKDHNRAEALLLAAWRCREVGSSG